MVRGVVGGMPAPKNPQVSAVVAAFFRAWSRGKKERTLERVAGELKHGPLAHFGDNAFSEVTTARVDAALRDALEKRGPTATNLFRRRGCQLWRWAIREGLWDGRNPWEGAPLAAEAKKRPTVVDDDARRVDDRCWDNFEGRGPRIISPVFAAYFLLMLRIPFRRSEGTHLAWPEVHWRAGVIRIAGHKTEQQGVLEKPLTDSSRRLLEKIRERGWDDHWVFPSKRSKRGHIEDPYHAWQALRKAAGVPDATIHSLRRGIAKMAHDAGADLLTVRDMLGHSSVKTTERYIGRSSTQRVREATELVAGKLRSA